MVISNMHYKFEQDIWHWLVEMKLLKLDLGQIIHVKCEKLN